MKHGFSEGYSDKQPWSLPSTGALLSHARPVLAGKKLPGGEKGVEREYGGGWEGGLFRISLFYSQQGLFPPDSFQPAMEQPRSW